MLLVVELGQHRVPPVVVGLVDVVLLVHVPALRRVVVAVDVLPALRVDETQAVGRDANDFSVAGMDVGNVRVDGSGTPVVPVDDVGG